MQLHKNKAPQHGGGRQEETPATDGSSYIIDGENHLFIHLSDLLSSYLLCFQA